MIKPLDRAYYPELRYTINLKSLSKIEMTNNNGGFAIGPFLLGALAGGIVYDCVWHWGETSASVKKGFREGMADY